MHHRLRVAAVGLGLVPPIRCNDELMPLNARFLVAARNADGPAMERVLREGANVNARNRLGETALVVALKQDRVDLAQVMLAAGADVNRAA